MGRAERLQAKMERLVQQAESQPGQWFHELSSRVRYENGTYYVDAYGQGSVHEFHSSEPAVSLLTRSVIHEVATERPELRDTY